MSVFFKSNRIILEELGHTAVMQLNLRLVPTVVDVYLTTLVPA
jgi:hypothetical protein